MDFASRGAENGSELETGGGEEAGVTRTERIPAIALAITLLSGTLLGGTLLGRAALRGGDPPEIPTDTLAETIPIDRVPLGLDEPPPPPENSPLTEERAALGRRLFFDPRLSRDSTVACASCHRPDHGFATSDPVAVGIEGRRGTRNAPSLLNRAWGEQQFWDGRAATLEAQALEPITNPLEFDHTVEGVLERLRDDPSYVTSFRAAFGGDANESPVISENLARALASFVRTLRGGESPLDRFQAAENYDALSDEARQGLWIFESRGKCWRCHSGPNLTDEKFHNTGIAHLQAEPDQGRSGVTQDRADRNKFKTPSLRGVARTPPYMHDGSLATLRDVVLYYSRGGNLAAPGLAPELDPLDLTEREVGFLVALLEVMSSAPPNVDRD